MAVAHAPAALVVSGVDDLAERPPDVVVSGLGFPESVVVDIAASVPVHLEGVATSLVVSPLLVTALRVVLGVFPLFGSVPGHVLLKHGEVGVGMNSVELSSRVKDVLEALKIVGVLELIIEVFNDVLVDVREDNLCP